MAKSSIRLRIPNEERPVKPVTKSYQEGTDNGGKLAEDIKEPKNSLLLSGGTSLLK